ncbi:TPA: hypothetical protein ACH3X1_005539 [Trebouxia sp. C0004]
MLTAQRQSEQAELIVDLQHRLQHLADVHARYDNQRGTSWAHCKSNWRKLVKWRNSNTGKVPRENIFCQMEQ